MSDKPMAVLMTALVVAPICVTCLVGPAVLGSLIAGLWGWFSGNELLVAIALVIAAASLAHALKRRQSRVASISDGCRQEDGRGSIKTSGDMSHE